MKLKWMTMKNWFALWKNIFHFVNSAMTLNLMLKQESYLEKEMNANESEVIQTDGGNHVL